MTKLNGGSSRKRCKRVKCRCKTFANARSSSSLEFTKCASCLRVSSTQVKTCTPEGTGQNILVKITGRNTAGRNAQVKNARAKNKMRVTHAGYYHCQNAQANVCGPKSRHTCGVVSMSRRGIWLRTVRMRPYGRFDPESGFRRRVHLWAFARTQKQRAPVVRVCIHTCIWKWMYLSIHNISMYVLLYKMNIRMYVLYPHVFLFFGMQKHIYIYIYIYIQSSRLTPQQHIYVCMYVCVYIYIYIYGENEKQNTKKK